MNYNLKIIFLLTSSGVVCCGDVLVSSSTVTSLLGLVTSATESERTSKLWGWLRGKTSNRRGQQNTRLSSMLSYSLIRYTVLF